jgi:putative heme-binding domain-containing protein
MTMPMGALWHQGALYVASPPYIWRLEDTDDDGVADKRDVVVGRFGFIGNAADIHGCFLGPNGRLYWCDGRHGHEFVDEQGQIRSKGKAARIFSSRLDGSDIQAHCGGGMDNPVEIDFTPEGEMLGTVNLFYQQRGDCLVHWMHGGAYPRYDQEASLAEFKRTGDLLPPVLDLGHVAVSGMTRYRGVHFGDELQGNVFIALFNKHQVVRLSLTREGSTFRASLAEFWTSDNPDCHPTDVLEDADGSLLIIDTGGWFRHGCPTSQVAKPDILGAIYRVRRSGGPSMVDPRGINIDWSASRPEQLASLLGDPRHKVCDRAIQELAAHGDAVIAPLLDVVQNDSPRIAKQHAIWTLTRIESPASLAAVRTALSDTDPLVRLAAASSAAATRDRQAVERLLELLSNDEPPVRREAATALGRIGDPAAVGPLLEAATQAGDRLLEHAVIYALIELNAPQATAAGLSADDSRRRRAALIALDQMDAAALDQQQVASILDTDDLALQQAALEIVERRGWAADFVAQLDQWLQVDKPTEAQRSLARGALTAFISEPGVQPLVMRALEESSTPTARELVLEAIPRSDLESIPVQWQPHLARVLVKGAASELELALAAIRRSPSSFADELRAVSADVQRDPRLRQSATILLARAGTTLSDAEWKRLIDALSSETDPLERLQIAEAIGMGKLSDTQLRVLIELIPTFGALELASTLHAFASSGDAQLGEALLLALQESNARETLSPRIIDEVLVHQPASVREAAAELVSASGPERSNAQAELAHWESELISGDPQRGRQVFFSSQAACSACHTVDGQGARIGPDLSRIGSIRVRRDLIEAVVLPSSSLARGFESYHVTTTAGHVFLGIIQREKPDAIWLRLPDRSEVRIPRTEIEAMEPVQQSIMPRGLLNALRPEDRADLLAFLMSLR